MIELGIQPVIRPVAIVAGRGEQRCNMVWKGGFLEIRRMAGITLRGHRREVAASRAFVTGIAVHCRVRSG